MTKMYFPLIRAFVSENALSIFVFPVGFMGT